MALSNEELELQSAEYLPAREVMTSWGGGGCCKSGVFGGLVAVNTNVHDVNIVKDVNILTGHDNDGVDIDNILIGNIL
jgi:hypothetical protein